MGETSYWLTEEFCREHGHKGPAQLAQEFPEGSPSAWASRRQRMHAMHPELVPELTNSGKPVGTMPEPKVAVEKPDTTPYYLTEQFCRENGHLGPKRLQAKFGETGWPKRRGKMMDAHPELVPRLTPNGKPVNGAMPDAAPIAPVQELTPEAAVEVDREVTRLRDELSEVKRRQKALHRQENSHRKLMEMGREALKPVTPLCQAPKHKTDEQHVIHQSHVLSWADWHVDEVVDAEIMEGLNFYDPPTVLRRVECMVDKTIMFAHFSERVVFDTLYVHALGDFVTNTLRDGFDHADAAVTASMQPIKGARFAATLMAYALRDLAPHYERVVFRGVPGNHGRFTKGMSHKLPTENLDWLVYEWTRTMASDIPNIEWDIPEAWSLTCEVSGWGFFLNHGYSDAKGGFGGISWYSLVKSDTKRTALDVKLNRKVLARQYGHMHQDVQVPRAGGNGVIRIEPSLMGGNEYPKEGMAGTFDEPGQSLLEVHDTEGITAPRHLNVRQHDYNETCRYDPILDLL